MHRREFLEQNLRFFAFTLLPSGLLQACTSPSGPKETHGSVMAPSHYLSSDGKGTVFSFYDLDRDLLREISLPLETPHIAISHPVRKHLVFVPESAGTGGCLLDVKEMKVLKRVQAMEGRLFGGHGEFTPDGKLLYLSEFEAPPSGKGFVSVWSGDSFEPLRSFSSHGRFPHDVTLSQDAFVVTAANLGAEIGSHVKYGGIFVAKIDRKTERLLERVELNENPDEVSVPPGQLALAKYASADQVIKRDARYFISYMAVTRPHLELFFYPHPHAPMVGIWDVRRKQLIREIVFADQPMALVFLQGRNKIAVATKSGKLHFVDVQTKALDHSIQATKLLKVTTHISKWTGDSSGYS